MARSPSIAAAAVQLTMELQMVFHLASLECMIQKLMAVAGQALGQLDELEEALKKQSNKLNFERVNVHDEETMSHKDFSWN